jgi:ArsR family transcriptional regulator, nickel/cobalt-responsive transcriptional repressor
MTSQTQAKAICELLSALSEPNRLRIIEILRTGQRNVTELAQILESEIVNVSHHLSVLRRTGLVQDRKEGRFVNYTLHPNVFNIEKPDVTVMDVGWCRIEIPHM